MHLCLYIKKSVNSLPSIILKLYNRNNTNYYQSIRMSDLRDELYEENSSVNPNNGQISSQSKISSNKKINFNHEENGLNSGKKKIIRVKLKISNIKSSGETENATSMEMLNKKSYISEHCDDYECVEIKILGRSQTTELVKSSKIYSELDFNENLSISDDIGIVENNIKTSSQFLKQDLRKNDYVISKDDDSTNKFEEEEYIEALLNREQRILEKLSASLRKGASRKDSLINDQECNNNSENTCEGDTNNETSTATLSKLSEKANRKQEEIWIDTSISNVGTPKGSGDEMAVKKEVNPLTSIEEYDNIKTSADEENKSTYPNNERKKSYDKNTITDHKWKNVYKNYLLLDNNNSGKIIDFQDKQEQENGQKMSYKTDGKSLPTTTKLLNGNNSTTNHQNVPCLPDEEKIKDSSIITDIVMKKYEEILRKFKQRSLQRKQNRKGPLVCENKEHIGLNQKLNRPTSLAIKNVPCTLSSSQLFNKTPDSGLDATQELYFSNFKSRESVQSSDQSLTYSPTIFLKEALGDEYMNTTYESEQENSGHHYSTPVPHCSTGRSIGTSEISMLISTVDGVDSLYSTINKYKKRSTILKKTSVVHPLFNSASSKTHIYESLDKFKINPKSDELHNAIFLQRAIITQASKALSLCRESSRLFGSTPHLEAEKYLLLATYRKSLLENQLNREYEEMESEQCYGRVNVENLAFSLNTTRNAEMNDINHYYLCLVHSDITLLASDIVFPERNGNVIFKESFEFNNLTSDFEIYIKIFSMVLEDTTHKEKTCFSPNKRHLTWRNGKIYNKHINRLSGMSSFHLLGMCKLGILDLYKVKTFTLENVSPSGRISQNFTANIRSSIEMTNHISGFLTIGTTNILWNRRWCTLDGLFLKYWNYPSDENVKEPVGIFDLSNCTTSEVIRPDKAFCSRPRTIMLQMLSEHGTMMQYFLQADNMFEFEEWKRQLNLVLISLSSWKCLKC